MDNRLKTCKTCDNLTVKDGKPNYCPIRGCFKNPDTPKCSQYTPKR
jgi:hypothetical protein